MGCDYGMQPGLRAELMTLFQRLKSCVSCDDVPVGRPPATPLGVAMSQHYSPGSEKKRSLGSGGPICDAGPPKRARQPSPEPVLADSRAHGLPGSNPSLLPQHVPPLACMSHQSSPAGLHASPIPGHATGSGDVVPAGFGIGPATGMSASTPLSPSPVSGLPVPAPMPPAAGLEVAPPVLRAKGVHVPPPSRPPRSPNGPVLHGSMPLSGQGHGRVQARGPADGRTRRCLQPPQPPAPPLRPQPSHAHAVDNASPTLSDILERWTMDAEACAAMWALFHHSPSGKSAALQLVVALSTQAHCLCF